MNLNPQNFAAAINQVCDEKKINAEAVFEAVADAIKAAYRKDFGNRDQNLEVILDHDTGKANVLLVKKIVEEVENPQAEISVVDAQQIKKGLKVGAKIKIDVTPFDYGRIASQSAKQVIIQKIQEAERKAIYAEYSDREDELLNALVHRVDGRFVHLELDRTTAILEPRDQIPRERYQQGQRVKVYLEKVELTPRGSMLKVSRTHPRLIFRLMELEIPEVRNGTVVVKAIARDAGVRCKLVVDSTDPNVDPVGACVGQRGVRIQNITDEVNGERIDVIEFSEDFETMLKEVLSPAKLDHFVKHDDEKRVEVYVAEDQRALAIGKNGQNVRLAGEIMGWEIDILNTAELSGEVETEEKDDSRKEKSDSEKPTEDEKTEKPAKKKTGEKKSKEKKDDSKKSEEIKEPKKKETMNEEKVEKEEESNESAEKPAEEEKKDE
ncbi:transcription termination factor NusA [Candidatus Gracilibacteria bacterium]|nr:transcription termination factor NusA [Candidatus Gracilibacteria bacterium]MCF7855997.1 transcription termination factor NusA [Candidatus Gracilibacteria bacterium]MCF7896310.1 transcription termination factor NusA [Candidatus Gracilibacteria bacterium]